MAQQRKKSEFSLQYTVMVPALDMRRNRATVPVGLLTKAVGVDGRFAGAIRRFPGMKQLRRVKFETNTKTVDDIKFFKCVSFQKGNTAYVLRGYVIAARNADDNKYDIELQYYDTETSAWAYYAIATDIASWTDPMDVATAGKYLYYVRWNSAPQVIFHDGTSIVKKVLGPGNFASGDANLSAPGTGTVQTSGGVLRPGRYLVAYRYRDTARNVYSGLSEPLDLPLTVGNGNNQYLPITKSLIPEASTNIEDFDAVEIYRTIEVSVAGDSFSGGVFFRVGTTSITDDGGTRSWTYDMGRQTTDNLDDRRLTQQPYYDPILDEATTPPNVGRIATYQGITFLGGSGGTGTGDSRAEVRWSPLHKYEPENFPTDNKFRLPSIDTEIMALQVVGDYLYAVSRTVLYRFQRVGTKLVMGRMHFGKGLGSYTALAEVDDSLLLVTSAGILLIKPSGAITVIGALDRLVMDDGEWAGSLDNVSIATDQAICGTFILEPDNNEACVIWHNTNAATRLEDCYFAWVSPGIEPESGTGVTRAFFITNKGLIVYPDADRTNTKRTMLGVSGTVNGTSTAGASGATVLTDSSAGFLTTGDGLQDCYLHILSGNLKGTRCLIASNTATAIVVSSAVSPPFDAGLRYSVSPIPYKIRFWPLSFEGDQGYPRDLFRRWIVTSLGVAITDLSSDGDADNDFWTVGAYRQSGATMAVDAEVAISENPAGCYGAVSCDGLQVEPGIECMASNTEFELTALQVQGKITVSKEVTASS